MKPNQDSFISVKSLAGIDGLWMFGVCDGHGVNGHLVSDFVKKNLPRIISSQISGVVGPPLIAVKNKKNRESSMVTKKKSGGL
jgi:serine/threonine protein phosphatase PrpC